MFQFKHKDGRQITTWRRSLPVMMQFCMKKLNNSILQNALSVEACLGIDNGKGSYSFLATILMHHDNNSDPYRLEIKIGEINEEKDNVDCVEQLISKISYGLDQMKINEEEDCSMSLENLHQVTFLKENSTSGKHCRMKFHEIDNIKGEFQMIGRSGFDSSYSLRWKCRPNNGSNSAKTRLLMLAVNHGP